MRPNVLLVVFDAARADAFEPWGASPGSSPVVADLARRGSYVSHAYAAGSWTVPSHAAMFTGLLPRAAGLSRAPGGTPHGCRHTLEGLRGRLLAEVLRREGYETSAVSANGWLAPGSGFETGFDRFCLVDSQRDSSLMKVGRRAAARAGYEALRARVDDGAETARDTLRGWAAEERTRPFFWFVNLVEAHSPFLPPSPFNPLGPIQRVKAAIDARRYSSLDAIWQANLGLLKVPRTSVDRMKELYAGSIRLLDTWLGDILESLDQARLLDETLVIVTADHGENLGEGGRLGHSFSLDERLLRVPLVFAGPGHWPGGEVQSLASLPVRVAAAIGLPVHPWSSVPDTEVAVAQFDPPTDIDDPRVQLALKIWGADQDVLPALTTSLTSASDGTTKVVRRGLEWEVYDLLADPLESSPSGDFSSAISQHLREAALQADAHVAAPADAHDADLSDAEKNDLEERMRLLGYL